MRSLLRLARVALLTPWTLGCFLLWVFAAASSAQTWRFQMLDENMNQVLSTYEADPYTINVGGSGEAQLTNTPESESYPKWSSRGIAFTVWAGGDDRQVYRMNADGTGVTQLTRGGTPSFQAAWKP